MSVQDLGLAVLELAVRDAHDTRSMRRRWARAWLCSGDPDLQFWCSCADVRPHFVAQLARWRR